MQHSFLDHLFAFPWPDKVVLPVGFTVFVANYFNQEGLTQIQTVVAIIVGILTAAVLVPRALIAWRDWWANRKKK